jgi:homoserine dehydrogenase
METLNISIAGMGAVGKELIKILPDNVIIDKILVKNLHKHEKTKNVTLDMNLILKSDLIVDVMDDVDTSRILLKKCFESEKNIVLCNKEFVKNNIDLICHDGLYKSNVYMHGIVCSNNLDEFIPIDHTNLKSFIGKGYKIFGFRGGGPQETAKFILSDIMRSLQ